MGDQGGPVHSQLHSRDDHAQYSRAGLRPLAPAEAGWPVIIVCGNCGYEFEWDTSPSDDYCVGCWTVGGILYEGDDL